MAFGLSGANGRAQMSQSDVVVAFYDTTARVFRAEDYFLSDLSQCDGQNGACPDERIGARNDVVVCKYFSFSPKLRVCWPALQLLYILHLI